MSLVFIHFKSCKYIFYNVLISVSVLFIFYSLNIYLVKCFFLKQIQFAFLLRFLTIDKRIVLTSADTEFLEYGYSEDIYKWMHIFFPFTSELIKKNSLSFFYKYWTYLVLHRPYLPWTPKITLLIYSGVIVDFHLARISKRIRIKYSHPPTSWGRLGVDVRLTKKNNQSATQLYDTNRDQNEIWHHLSPLISFTFLCNVRLRDLRFYFFYAFIQMILPLTTYIDHSCVLW